MTDAADPRMRSGFNRRKFLAATAGTVYIASPADLPLTRVAATSEWPRPSQVADLPLQRAVGS